MRYPSIPAASICRGGNAVAGRCARFLLSFILFSSAAVVVVAAPVRAQGISGFGEELLGQFEGSAEKLVALAQAMPAESYSWQPMEGVYTVAAAYMHIARYNYMYPDLYLGVDPPPRVDYESLEERVTSKHEAVEILAASMDHVRGLMNAMSEADLAAPTRLYGREVENWAVLLQLVTHMNEHLGQSIAYARMNGVVPPWSR